MNQDEHSYVCNELGKAEEYIKELEAKLAIAVEELEWYADQRNCDNPDFAHVEIDDGEEIADGGYRARKALAKIRDQK